MIKSKNGSRIKSGMTVVLIAARRCSYKLGFLGLGCHFVKNRDLKVCSHNGIFLQITARISDSIPEPAGNTLLVNAESNKSANFKIIGNINHQRTFATGTGIREIARLRRVYGEGRWRKRKGIAKVRFMDGTTRTAEVHWYEATGIGRFEFKIKCFVD